MAYKFLSSPLILVLFGFVLGLIPQILSRARRISSHIEALIAEIEICRKFAEKFLTDGIKSPLYRLPLTSFQTSYPVLLAEGVLQENHVFALTEFFIRSEEINRGLDYADEMRKANAQDIFDQEVSRLTLKAQNLTNDLYPKVIKIFKTHSRNTAGKRGIVMFRHNIWMYMFFILLAISVLVTGSLWTRQVQTEMRDVKQKYETLKNSYVRLASTQSELLERLIKNINLKQYIPEYKDLSREEFQEKLRRKIIMLQMEIEKLKNQGYL